MAKGTIKGRLHVRVLEPDGTYSTKPLVCVKVKSKNNSTHTKDTGWFSISDDTGPHELKFVAKHKDEVEVEIYSEVVTINADEERIKDITLDPKKTGKKVRDILLKLLKNRDPGLPGCVSGKVHKKNKPSIIIPGARIWIPGVMETYSDQYGRYCFCVPSDPYTLWASHPTDYQDWNGPVTVPEADSLTKNIPMTPA
jgi:hypothetical protein